MRPPLRILCVSGAVTSGCSLAPPLYVTRAGYFHEIELSDFNRQMQVNYFGVLHVVHAVYPDMVRRNQGHIVIVGSALSTFGAWRGVVGELGVGAGMGRIVLTVPSTRQMTGG